ncbi:hypothetical protein GT037_008856 [Alternaria burnsii]|uniref:Ankyrin n=1 Tax=Alternaria burnsii TaxID=1187904 RepID=A0A8H7B1J2_9PLEO|nr:uncharacterized protein GT037_008856 [Alternaria burnsii]KAF7672905.1 hypothetical protein GT037_008856 [Alternaria burnsii]
MDPLSVAGSIAGLISLSDAIFRKLYHYVKDVKSAEKEVQDLKNEIAALNGVLHNVHLIAQDLETSSLQDISIRPDHINSCLATLYRLDEKMNKAAIFDKGKIRATIHKLSWPFKSVNAKKFIEDIRSHRNHLNFALSADTMAALLQCLSKQDQLLSNVASLETRLRDQQNIDTKIVVNAERQKILDSFLSVNPEDSFRTNTRIRHATTGFWLTGTDEFTKWMQGSNLHLWLSGIPGAGKTILSSLIIQQCLKQATDDRAVAFFYCDYKNTMSQDVVQILSSLASQLARQHESCFQLLKDYDNKLRPQHQLRRSPEVDELTDLLRKMSDHFEDVRLIVDGLDECNEQAGAVASTLRSLGDGHAVISMCFLSRDELDIRTELEAPMFEHIEIAAHTEDVEHYVRSEIEERLKKKKLRLKSRELKDEIVHQLVTRAQGMFRWVSCQLDHLCELPTDALRRKALTCLPSTLNETYARVLMRVEKSARPLVRRTLQWIAYAERPALSDEQLLEIVAIDEDDEDLDPEACPDLEDLLRYCGSLVRRTSGSIYDYTNNSWCASTILELAHFTVQEFLEAIIPNDTELNEFRLSSIDKLTLAKTCLNYLCLPSFNRPPVDFEKDYEDHPFYEHVSRHLIIYVHRFAHEEDLQKRLQRLFRPPKSHSLTRFVLHNIQNPGIELRKEGRFNKVCSYEFGSIHVAAMLRLGTVCQWLIDEGCDANQKSMLGTPLELAIFDTSFERKIYRDFHNPPPPLRLQLGLSDDDGQGILSVLLKNGAIWNTEGVDTKALYPAVSSVTMEEDLVEMLRHGMPLLTETIERLEKVPDSRLIKKFSDVIHDAENAKIPLEVKLRVLDLARTRHIELEASGLPVDTTRSAMKMLSDKAYAEAIVYTAKYGPVSNLVHLTTDERFTVDMKGLCHSATLLHIAAEHNSTQCMELLLDKHFDAAHLDKHGRSVLHCAIDSGVQEVALLRRLVQSNATEIVDCDGRSVWHVTAKEGRLDVLDILITELGSNHPFLCMQSKLGRTPLLEAVLYRQRHIASRILRSLPAEKTFAVDPQVVHSAVATGLEDIFRELVEMGASLDIRSDQNQSALYFITQETTPGILRTLLDHGLEVDRLDSYGRSPFLDFLEVDQHSQRLEALGYSKSDSTSLDLSVMELLITPFCAMTQDKTGNLAWFYFCTKTIPHCLLRQALSTELGTLIGLLDVLIERGVLKVYEEATTNSGIALSIKACLDTVSKTNIEDQETILPFVKAVLGHVPKTTTVKSLFATHPEAVRLLIWSMTQSDNDALKQLLGLGIDVHATCEDYGGNSAIDIAIEGTIKEKTFDMILTHADPVRIPKLHADGSLRHFVLCVSPKLIQEPVKEMELPTATNISKLKAILKRGVDPNVKDSHCRTTAHSAAQRGDLECIKVLVAYHADLTITSDFGWTAIHEAVANGNIFITKYVRQLLQDQDKWERCVAFSVPLSALNDAPLGPLPQVTYHHGTLAHLAVYNHSSEMLQFLQDNDLVDNINATTQEGATPLHFAVCISHPQTTRWLLNNGADVNAKCGIHNTSALHVAFRLGCLDNAIALVEAGADFSADSAGITPEMQVDPTICADLLELLPNIGVPIPPTVMEGIRRRHQLKSSGNLFRAIVNGDFDACRSIIAAAPCFPKRVKKGTRYTPLIVALVHNQLDIAKLFLDHGASTNGVSREEVDRMSFEASALEIAVKKPMFNSLLEQLLEQCLSHETHWSQRFGYWRPFHIAAAYNPGAIEILASHVLAHVALFRGSLHSTFSTFDISPSSTLKAGLERYATDIDAVSLTGLESGFTTLHVAITSGNSEAVDVLLKYGVDAGVKDENGFSPLHYAAAADNSILVEKLLKAGARLDAIDFFQKTPLISAARRGAVQAASTLVEHGADLVTTDLAGQTALHHAARKQKLGMFMFLLDAGSDAYQLDDKRHSPVYYALSQAQLATYVYARCLSLAHIFCADIAPKLGPGIHALRSFLCYCSETTRRSYLTMATEDGDTVFIDHAIYDGPDYIQVCIKAGAQLEATRNNGDTALLAACRAGRIPSVAYLVRHGAKLEYGYQGRAFNAYIAASRHPEIVRWLLVERWTEQGKLGSEPANSGEEAQCQPWTGVRTVKIPLRGDYERPEGLSLLDHVKYLHGVAKGGWRILVPLGWDTIANLVQLPGEV